MKWIKQLTKKEQKLLKYGGLIIIVSLFWALVYKPLTISLEQKQKRLVTLSVQYKDMQNSKHLLVQQQQKATKFHRDLNKPFISWIDEQLEKNTLSNSVTRSEPKDNQTLILTFESVIFDNLASWLQELEQNYAINISEADINLTDRSNGLCNARITLEEKK
jgi:general secretion pathway protein M